MRNSDSDNEVMKKWKTRSRGGDESGTKHSFCVGNLGDI